MIAAWDGDEVAWARECAAAGDTPAEIAEASGRPLAEVQLILCDLKPMTEREREAASLYAAGVEIREIGRLMKPETPRPDSLGWSYLRTIRDKGYSVPFRRTAEAVARTRARAFGQGGAHG